MPEPATITLVSTGFVAMMIRHLRRKYREAKPWFDRIVALLLLIPCGPIIGLCALLVKLTSRGPAFYTQERVGMSGQVFNMIKLRTMRHDAEAQSGPVWAADEDPRATPLGQILRKTFLDELPQLINVLRGEMSLVGPRPERPCFVKRLKDRIPGYDERLKVKPGITGLAQVSTGADHSEEDVKHKLEFDTRYVKKMCWWLDFVVLLRTFRKLAVPEGRRERRERSGLQEEAR